MSLVTLIHAGMQRRERPSLALVLMGGGARTAYQVGVLRALATMLRASVGADERRAEHATDAAFPFQVLIGTSAGAINAAFLAGRAALGLAAFDDLAVFWSRLRSADVYRMSVPAWARVHRFAAIVSLSRHIQAHGAMLDSTPLREMLRAGIHLEGIERALRGRAIDALAVTASSYSSGVHWTFCQTAGREVSQPWSHPGRRAEFQALTIDHLMASSAIPFLFPSAVLRVDGHEEHFGDGAMRQIAPLSPAWHLGASRVLVVGVGQPENWELPGESPARMRHGPTLGSMAGHVMASVFHDTLQADVEQTLRVAETISQLPADAAAAMAYRPLDVLSIAPTCSLDALAQRHTHELPLVLRQALAALGVLKGSGGALASYLLFEPGFINALIALGESDALAKRRELLQLVLGG